VAYIRTILYVNDSLEGSTDAKKRKWGHAGAKKTMAKKVTEKKQVKKVYGLYVQTSFFCLLFSRNFRPLETNDVVREKRWEFPFFVFIAKITRCIFYTCRPALYNPSHQFNA
jgi:hypothetical protein